MGLFTEGGLCAPLCSQEEIAIRCQWPSLLSKGFSWLNLTTENMELQYQVEPLH